MKIGIVNNSLSNVGSIYSALRFYNYRTLFIDNPVDLKEVDIIVLAGVGNFKTAVTRLKEFKLWDALNKEILEKRKPVFGICLGMQLFANVSYEGGENRGFGWISGKVVKIAGDSIKVPHIGWNIVKNAGCPLFKGMRYNSFYFMHSYHFVPDDKERIAATTNHGNLEIVSAVRKDNIIGVQFHPEKSQGDGLRLIRNIVEEML